MSDAILVIPASEFVQQVEHVTTFLVDPYVPAGGIIFLYGKTSIGKSPLTWELARCVAGGVPFLGCPTRMGTVLYLEVDTPAPLVRERLKVAPTPPGWIMAFARPFNILAPYDATVMALKAVAHDVRPNLVIVNTLRKAHWADDRESHIPGRIYGAFQSLFPGAAVWFNHHDKKSGNPAEQGDPDEAFSGSQAWLNDATVGLHLVTSGQGKGMLNLVHTKTQVSARRPALTLRLEPDGTTITPYDRAAEVRAAYELTDASLSARQRVKLTADALGRSESSVWEWLSK